MAILIDKLNSWIATLPEYAGQSPSLAYRYERDGVPRYIVTTGEQRAIFKLYIERTAGAPSPYNRNAQTLAEAEAVALREYAEANLAPELLWQGEMPGEIGGYGVIYRWIDGLPADAGDFSAEDAVRLADVLWAIHESSPGIKLVAPHPRDLAAWWIRRHEQYRELSPDFIAALPRRVEAALSRLTQSVAGDANAHKRFWGTSRLAPVHGAVEMHNVIVQPDRVVLVDWSRYGLGDGSYELANAVWNMAIAGREEHIERVVEAYTSRADDVMLEHRVQIYRRLLPYGRWLDLLSRLAREDAPTPGDLKHGPYYLFSAMTVYGGQETEISDAVRDFTAWLSGRQA